jgi:hypothetical protein
MANTIAKNQKKHSCKNNDDYYCCDFCLSQFVNLHFNLKNLFFLKKSDSRVLGIYLKLPPYHKGHFLMTQDSLSMGSICPPVIVTHKLVGTFKLSLCLNLKIKKLILNSINEINNQLNESFLIDLPCKDWFRFSFSAESPTDLLEKIEAAQIKHLLKISR